jgi:hypothetical protein
MHHVCDGLERTAERLYALPPTSNDATTAMVTITTVSSRVIFQCTFDLLER